MIYQWPLSLAACSLIRNNSPSPMNNQSSYPERMHSGIANNACLKIEGTNDQFQDDKHKDWKEVSNVLYAIHQSRARSISTGGRHTGDCQASCRPT